MAKPRVIIVDDQKEVVRLLHSAIDSTGHEIEVIEAPSGEEALLEASAQPVDLLIVDYMLPGMSGLELLKKMRRRQEEIKAIVITGQTARSVHREIMNADAQAFFVKPVPMADFLDAVERILGLIDTILPVETYANEALQKENLSDLLANLRRNENAHAVILLDEQVRPMIQAGDLPIEDGMDALYAALMPFLGNSMRVLNLLDGKLPQQIFIFRLTSYDLLILPVNYTHMLLVAGEGFLEEDRWPVLQPVLNSVRAEVRELLRSLGIEGDLPAEPAAAAAENVPVPVDEEDDEPIAEDLAKLFENPAQIDSDPNAFWEDAAGKHAPQPFSPDVITYEQAMQLGLAPDEEENIEDI